VTISCLHYLLLLKWKKIYGSSPHLQEDSNALKYVIFGYCMNKLWIFEVWSIASPKTWVGSTKTLIQHDLQLVYIFGLLQCVFSAAGLLFAYSRKWGNPGFRKTTLVGTWSHINELSCWITLTNTIPGGQVRQKLNKKRSVGKIGNCWSRESKIK
jgi:hypothetical protein